VPYRPQSTEASVAERKRYSPHQSTPKKMDYALARVDDLVNWARKVGEIFVRLFSVPKLEDNGYQYMYVQVLDINNLN